MSVTDEIKNRLDLVDIVSEQVSLRRSGRSYTGFCPFHSNTRTPAFVVFPETQTWRCFGECATGGDLFDYVMKKEGYDFKEALRVLAERAGVTLEEVDPQVKKRRQAEDKLVDLLTMAAEYFHQLFLHAPQAGLARTYIEGRRLNEETIATFRLGYALDSWDACRTHFTDQGYSDAELLAAGLLTENPDKGTRYDRFRNRLMIPIRDIDGRVVGFGARTLQKDGIPKYLNSPQTDVFDKGRLLFGLDLARRQIRETREAVIVEGYMDVMQGWQAGFRNMVAQMGTALSGDQLQLVNRFTRSSTSRTVPRIILSLDADPAGQKATARGLEIARQTLERVPKTEFTGGGTRRDVGLFRADVRIVVLPEGKDPDQIIRDDPDAWRSLIADSKPLVNYIIDEMTRDLDMSDVRTKDSIAQQIMPLIRELPSELEQEQYRLMLARALQTDERTLRFVPRPAEPQAARQARTQPPPPDYPDFPEEWTPAPQRVKPAVSKISREANFLRQCLQYPHLLLQVNQHLLRHNQPALGRADFSIVEDKQILALIYERVDQAPVVGITELCDSLDEVLASRIEQLMRLPATPESELPRLPQQLAKSVLDWRADKVHAQLAELQQLLIEMPAEDAVERRAQLMVHIQELQRSRQQISRAKDAMTGVGQRRAEKSGGHRIG